MNYYFGDPLRKDIYQIIKLSDSKHFSKVTCSLLPTVEYWKNRNLINETLINETFDVCFEYPVSSIKNATASYTDVMLISKNICLAVESKWNENKGITCNKHNAKRKDEVQKHWIKIINDYLGTTLELKDFGEIEYQLLHRVASACSLNKERCVIVYQIFYNKQLKNTFEKEILKFLKIINSKNIDFYTCSVKVEFTKSYQELKEEIADKSREERVQLIKDKISKNTLFLFSDENLKPIII